MDINRLTLYSHGAGCGCKIAPDMLSDILSHAPLAGNFPHLLVGNHEKDDAAVLDLGDGTLLVSTTDFFMPIVDDPYDFGRIAAVNALSDIYAMGGTPLMAIAILGWPVQQLPAEMAGKVLQGGQTVCHEAGIPLAGGHSIDSVEPFFGLAVTGRIPAPHLKRNKGALPGDLLYLSKSIGTGILTTAEKLERLRPEDRQVARDSMLILNNIGTKLGALPFVHAMTDVTGFGLLGHLLEMCEASGVGATLYTEKIPLLSPENMDYYLLMQCVPAATERNWKSYGQQCTALQAREKSLLCDPQTSGGLLIAIAPEHQSAFETYLESAGHAPLTLIGKVRQEAPDTPRIRIENLQP